MRPARTIAIIAVALVLSACQGLLTWDRGGEESGSDSEQTPSEPSEYPEDPDKMLEDAELPPAPAMGLRRLTAEEYDNALEDLLGNDIRPAQALSSPTGSTYGNAAAMQSPSNTLIEAAETLAIQAAETALSDIDTAESVLGCRPQGPDDEACLETFVRAFGRKAIRRPLTETEITELTGFIEHSIEQGDFLYGARMALRVMLQHAEFLYRRELGRPVEGEQNLFVLNGHEVATRMAFLLWGSTPDEELLAAAEAGELGTPEGRRAQAIRMIDGGPKERARTLRRLQHFHAKWLGYDDAQLGELSEDARAETDALIERVLFEEKAPWLDIFTWEETMVSYELARHYGLEGASEGAPAWVPYDESGRGGILSHATILNAGTKVGVTSPTMRGLHLYERLFCGRVPPPPPTIDVDDSEIAECGADGFCKSPAAASGFACETNADCPESLGCKSEYSAFYMRPGSGCANCHAQMDPLGLGLEEYGATGNYRTHEEEKQLPEGLGFEQPECEIEGSGKAPGLGEFRGPKELGELLAGSELIEQCATRQFYQFAWGHRDLSINGHPGPRQFLKMYENQDRRLLATLVELVSDESFGLRLDPSSPPPAEESETEDPEEAEEPVALEEGVDLGIMTMDAPMIDGNCAEFGGETLQFPVTVENYDNAGASCQVGWNGNPHAPRLFGCCEVSDATLHAVQTIDQEGPIWDDDGIAFVISSPVREKNDSTLKAEVNTNGVVNSSKWPDSQPVTWDANIERIVEPTADGYRIEYASDLPIDLSADPTAHCEFRINDNDEGTNGWAIAFGERLLRESTWGLCQFLPM